MAGAIIRGDVFEPTEVSDGSESRELTEEEKKKAEEEKKKSK